MQLAICDDDIKLVGWLETLLSETFGELPSFRCDTFLSAEELLKAVAQPQNQYEIYLLDIQMKEIDGLEAARRIRRQDKKAVIIFITSHKEQMKEAFEVLAFQYLVKPLDRNEVLRVLFKADSYISAGRCFFHFQFNKVQFSISCEDICYFESFRRLIRVHTVKKDYEYYGTMKQLAAELNPAIFVQVHAAYMINLNYLESFNGKYVMLQNQTGIPVSKTWLKSFNEAYRRYIWLRTV